MTKKHFEAFAETIATMENRQDAALVAATCIKVFRKINPNFDVYRFAPACQLFYDPSRGTIYAEETHRVAIE